MLQDLARAGIGTILGMIIGALPLVVAILHVVRPSERLLALMRPLSLAAIFAALHTLLFGLAAGMRLLPKAHSVAGFDVDWIAHGLAETFSPVALTFGLLTVAWLLVAAGLRRAT